ncbi:MAG: nucleotidyltransferase family protein [Wenzhouxiangellaceae bacterium]
MKAMILAAGRGERMRPLTDRLPKPMLPVAGKPLIEHQVSRLTAAGITEIVINLGWLGDTIRDHLGSGEQFGARITYSIEPPGALETAGGIVHALPLLGTAPFLLVNADVLCDFDLSRLRGRRPAGQAHLVMVPNPAHHPDGDFALIDDRICPEGRPRLTYGGIGVFDPALFAGLEPGRRPLRPVLEQAIAAGGVTGELHRGLWLDVGTPERLAQAQSLWPPYRR